MSHDFDHGIDWEELDRLVDGQVDEFEYRELLRRIDEHPEGWRRCALAFLEHQAFGKELKGVAEGSKSLYAFDEPVVASTEKSPEVEKIGPLEVSQTVDRRNKWIGQLSAWITMTACILVGLAVGNSSTGELRDVLRGRPTVDAMINQDNIRPARHLEGTRRTDPQFKRQTKHVLPEMQRAVVTTPTD